MQGRTRGAVTGQFIPLMLWGVPGRRKASTPAEYRDAFIARLRDMREQAELEPEDVAKELRVKRDTYLRWETRGLMPHQFIIPFCTFVGSDPYLLLTGEPFAIGKRTPERLLPRQRRTANGT